MRANLGIPMTLKTIANATNGVAISDRDTLIKSITTDSRVVEGGDLFIGIKGVNFDGSDYAFEAKKSGAYVLSSSIKHSDIFHTDTGCALLSLARYYSKTLPYLLYRIGITGSVGKTTTKEFLKILLSESYVTHASSGNFNNLIGLPMSVLSASENTRIMIMEMGMNHAGEISRLSSCLCPDIALITNIGTSHIGNLGSRESIAKAKLEITDGMDGGVLLIPDDEPLLKHEKNKKRFSFTDKYSDYFMESESDGGVSIYKNGKLYAESVFRVTGEHHKKCLLAAASAAIESGLSGDDLALGISQISDDNTRQNVFHREKYCFYTDFYNASRESVSAFIRNAQSMDFKGKKSLLLGDILELGHMSDEIHFEIGKSISPLVFSNLFVFGKNILQVRRGAIENGFPENRIFVNTDVDNFALSAMQIREVCENGDVIFMKASRGLRLERILNCFKEN